MDDKQFLTSLIHRSGSDVFPVDKLTERARGARQEAQEILADYQSVLAERKKHRFANAIFAFLALIGLAYLVTGAFTKTSIEVFYCGEASLVESSWWGISRKHHALKLLRNPDNEDCPSWHMRLESGQWVPLQFEIDDGYYDDAGDERILP